ncbi:hypothetical protein [Amycolatopsis pigmentata]|uniref:Uncharacterized protein n=1 Tax=Amycolatopsis pigmentata TaxID=450801 RepID=A0ABW5G5X9_9PSEU
MNEDQVFAYALGAVDGDKLARWVDRRRLSDRFDIPDYVPHFSDVKTELDANQLGFWTMLAHRVGGFASELARQREETR